MLQRMLLFGHAFRQLCHIMLQNMLLFDVMCTHLLSNFLPSFFSYLWASYVRQNDFFFFGFKPSFLLTCDQETVVYNETNCFMTTVRSFFAL